MVRIINYKERISEEGKTFFTLEVQGGIEMIKSKSTGNYYATAKRASIASTFDEETCKAILGSQLEGNVYKEDCEPYEYIAKDTGEVLTLNHKYIYLTDEELKERQLNSQETSIIPEMSVFTDNGIITAQA